MSGLDYVFIALVLFSCVAGIMRGLIREVIALVTWIAAVWLAWSYADALIPYLGGALAEPSVRTWAARTIIFLLVLLAGTAIGALVGYLVRTSVFSGLDRLLGALFGFLRGLIMISVIVMLCHALRLNGETWWRRSVLVPYVEHTANVLRAMVGERKINVEPRVAAPL